MEAEQYPSNWRVWWQQTPQSKPEFQIVHGTILDALRVENEHSDAWKTGRFSVEVTKDD